MISWGKTSTPFGEDVLRYLTDSFGFSVFSPEDYPEKRKSFLDLELRLTRPGDEKKKKILKGLPTYIVQDTRIYDSTMLKHVEALREECGSDDQMRERLEWMYENLSPTLEDDTSIGPRFGASEHDPNRLLQKLKGTMRFANDCGAPYICVAQRKSSYEWSHNHTKKMERDNIWEMPALKMMIDEFAANELKGLIWLHPHAPNEATRYCARKNMHFMNLNPQGKTKINDRKYDLVEYFREMGIQLDEDQLFPFDHYLSQHQEGLYRPDRCFVIAPDEGAHKNVVQFAQRHSLTPLLSLKVRKDEGVTYSEPGGDISGWLKEFISLKPDAVITFIILDDKINTGGTACEEAVKRMGMVDAFNKEYGTRFTTRTELWCTHLRMPYLNLLKHEDLDQLVFMNTVPYIPPLEEQLKKKGILHKTVLLGGADYNIAAGIALDYQEYGRHSVSQ
ncbi:MAG: hypothetical protein KJ709_09120 [Nanoarchaeota archaeon]|nr:hypothetical protein [Nanoarchaeota archaeon]